MVKTIIWTAAVLLALTIVYAASPTEDKHSLLSRLKRILRLRPKVRSLFALVHAGPAKPHVVMPVEFTSWLNLTGREASGIKKDYFGSYTHPAIHLTMLRDSPRTEAYLQACIENSQLLQGKYVLDVGCGTGILSFFAVWAGAAHVYCVENAEIAEYARKIVQDNNMTSKITVIRGLVEEISLPVPKVDVIISEWMGTFLLYESMLDSVLVARDRFLKSDGLMLPDKAVIQIAAFSGKELRESFIDSWADIQGINMSAIRELALSSPKLGTIGIEDVLTYPSTVLELDLYTTKVEDLDFVQKFSMRVRSNGTMDGVGGWFKVGFFSAKGQGFESELSTGPNAAPTHWRQTAFFLDAPLELVVGETVSGYIGVKKVAKGSRFLEVKLQVDYKGTTLCSRTYRIHSQH